MIQYLQRVGSADAAGLVATPAAASTFTAPQQATASAACTLGGYGRVMPEPYSVDASRYQELNPLPVTQVRAVAASHEIFAAKGCSATVVNDAGQVIGSKSSTKRPSSKNRAGMTYATDPTFDQA